MTSSKRMGPRARITERYMWTLLARESAVSADELRWLVERSAQSLRAAVEGRNGFEENAPPGATTQVGVARGRAEAEVERDTEDPPDWSTPEGAREAELWCLLYTLDRLAAAHYRTAVGYLDFAEKERRGRRATPYAGLFNNALEAAFGLRPKGRNGRPRVQTHITDADLLAAVESRAAKSSEMTALRELAGKIQREKSRSVVPDRLKLMGRLRRRLSSLRRRSKTYPKLRSI